MNTRSTQSGAAWLPIIIVLAIIVIGVGVWMYSQPATTGTPGTATTTSEAAGTDQGANVGAAVGTTTDAAAPVDGAAN